VVAVEQIEPLGTIPRPPLRRVKFLLGYNIIADGNDTNVCVHSLPSIIPSSPVVAGEVIIMSPGSRDVALETRCRMSINDNEYLTNSNRTLPYFVLLEHEWLGGALMR